MDEPTTDPEDRTTTTTTEDMSEESDREDVLELPERGTEAGPPTSRAPRIAADGTRSRPGSWTIPGAPSGRPTSS
ncbi:MAG: hypothetical protein K0R20_2774 [Actinomycetia bacterium]|nr:hypothetical protein [Actinomycetes bacterium]